MNLRPIARCLIPGYAAMLTAAAPESSAAESVPRSRTPTVGTTTTQFFGRGFELGFGTDFALEVDGIPLNTPSHVRGPGFLDKDLIIGELVKGCRYTKGPYQAGQGAFAVAGSAVNDLVSSLDEPLFSLKYGGASTDRYARLLWADHFPGARVTYGLEAQRADRPWGDLLGSARFNAAFRKEGETPGGHWSFTALGTENKSDGGAARPARPWPEGAGVSLGDTRAGDGTWSQRILLGWRLAQRHDSGATTRISLFGGGHHERRWNNWTLLLRDPQRGDQLEQVDRRMFLGGEGARTWTCGRGGRVWIHTLGLQARLDRVTAVEVWPTQNRTRVPDSPIPFLSARADLMHGALFGQSTLRWAEGWEAFLGMRLDAQSNHPSQARGAWAPLARSQALGSPKAGVAFSPVEGTRFALQAGKGFRIGDAFRDAQPMVRVRSAEFTAQTKPVSVWSTALTVWRQDLESESLFDPLVNAFTSRGATRHRGIELYNRVEEGPWSLEAAWGWSRATFDALPEGKDQVPGAPGETGFLGGGWKGCHMKVDVRLQRVGIRPLTEDNRQTADRQDEVTFRIQQDWPDWSVAVEVLNAFSRKTYNYEYYYASRLPGDSGPIQDRHLKAADPQTIRLEVRRRF
jgi:hypothetical protein